MRPPLRSFEKNWISLGIRSGFTVLAVEASRLEIAGIRKRKWQNQDLILTFSIRPMRPQRD